VSFELAAIAVQDPLSIEDLDDRDSYGEDRVSLLGLAQGTVLVVIYTERDERIRIISARRANKHEQDRYYREAGA